MSTGDFWTTVGAVLLALVIYEAVNGIVDAVSHFKNKQK